MIPPRPVNESARLSALRRCEILDTLPEQEFDDLTAMAAHICEVPIAILSLVDEDRQWFKSKVGTMASQTPRDISFCAHAILQPDLFIIPDALLDERFHENPLVLSEPHIRFYAGSPLFTRDGFALGTLCVIDRVPRKLTPDQEQALRILTQHVNARLELRTGLSELARASAGRERILEVLRRSRERLDGEVRDRTLELARANAALEAEIVERRRAEAALRQSEERYRRIVETAAEGIWQIDKHDRTTLVNPALARLLGYTAEEMLGHTLYAFMPEPWAGQARESIRHRCEGLEGAQEYALLRKDGSTVFVLISAAPLFDVHGEHVGSLAMLTDITERKRVEHTLRFTQFAVDNAADEMYLIAPGGYGSSE